MTKKIDPHGAALDLLLVERDDLEKALKELKPRIRKLNQLYQANDVLGMAAAVWLFGGNISELTKDSNELRRRLNSIEATRRLLKQDRADQLEAAWEEEQYILHGSSEDHDPYLPCGCW